MKKIISYKKKYGNLYELTLEGNEKINLYDDVILKYNLLLTKEIDNLNDIISDNNNLECYTMALKILSSKLRCESELRAKLKDYSNNAVDYTIDRLKKEGYLNDKAYIKAYVNDAINLKDIGPYKILITLKKLDIKEEDILEYLNTFDNSIWLNKLDKIIKKKINSNHNLSGSILKQKLINYLHHEGYSDRDINIVINKYDFQDNKDIYNKEYYKLEKKYSRKYSGEELDLRIKKALRLKGFK